MFEEQKAKTVRNLRFAGVRSDLLLLGARIVDLPYFSFINNWFRYLIINFVLPIIGKTVSPVGTEKLVARHSILNSRDFKIFWSDLDLSLVYGPKGNVSKAIKTMNKIKRIFPTIGEVEVYSQADWKFRLLLSQSSGLQLVYKVRKIVWELEKIRNYSDLPYHLAKSKRSLKRLAESFGFENFASIDWNKIFNNEAIGAIETNPLNTFVRPINSEYTFEFMGLKFCIGNGDQTTFDCEKLFVTCNQNTFTKWFLLQPNARNLDENLLKQLSFQKETRKLAGLRLQICFYEVLGSLSDCQMKSDKIKKTNDWLHDLSLEIENTLLELDQFREAPYLTNLKGLRPEP